MYTQTGLYEECLGFALGKIEEITGVERISIGRGYDYLVFHSMGIFKRSLRRSSKFDEPK